MAPRPVCSDAERRFAVACHDELRAAGHEAWVETHWVRPQHAFGIGSAAAVTALAGLVALGAPVAGLVAAAIGAACLALEAAQIASPLRLLLPRRATQVVLAGPAPGARVDVLLAARTDVPRRGWPARLVRLRGGTWWLVAAALIVVAACAARVADADGTLLGAVQLAPTVVLLAAVAGAWDAAAAPRGDGTAEDAAVRAAIAAHGALVGEPPPGIAAGLVLGGPDARRAHLRRERPGARRTALLIVREGPLRSRHRQWRAAAVAAGLPVRRGGPGGLPTAEAPPPAAEPLARALAATLD
jgi:hypothetical protein